MTRILVCLSAIVLLVGPGCRSSGSEFKFANRFPTPATGPSSPSVAAAAGPAYEEQIERSPDRRTAVDPALFAAKPRPASVEVWARPGCDPADRPVDPRLYRDDSRDTRRLEWEEQNVLAAQGRSPEAAAGVNFRAE